MMDVVKYRHEQKRKLYALSFKDEWTDADKLRRILYSIEPYSPWWRWGMVKALKRAIKLLEAEEDEE